MQNRVQKIRAERTDEEAREREKDLKNEKKEKTPYDTNLHMTVQRSSRGSNEETGKGKITKRKPRVSMQVKTSLI